MEPIFKIDEMVDELSARIKKEMPDFPPPMELIVRQLVRLSVTHGIMLGLNSVEAVVKNLKKDLE